MSSRKRHLNQALIGAVLLDDLPAVEKALADGADSNARDTEHQETPLMLARSEAIARLLLDRGADIHARDDRGATAFIPTRQPLLVHRGADINAQDNEGRTALVCAVEAARIDEVQQMLTLGANVSLQNADGQTALSLAEDYGFRAIAERLRSIEGAG